MKIYNAIIRTIAIASITVSMVTQSGNTLKAWAHNAKKTPTMIKDNPGTAAAIIGAAVALGLIYKHKHVIKQQIAKRCTSQEVSSEE